MEGVRSAEISHGVPTAMSSPVAAEQVARSIQGLFEWCVDGCDDPWGGDSDRIGRLRSNLPQASRFKAGRDASGKAAAESLMASQLALPALAGMRGVNPSSSAGTIPQPIDTSLFGSARRAIVLPSSQAHRWRILMR